MCMVHQPARATSVIFAAEAPPAALGWDDFLPRGSFFLYFENNLSISGSLP
jgi:hypothetical protein